MAASEPTRSGHRGRARSTVPTAPGCTDRSRPRNSPAARIRRPCAYSHRSDRGGGRGAQTLCRVQKPQEAVRPGPSSAGASTPPLLWWPQPGRWLQGRGAALACWVPDRGLLGCVREPLHVRWAWGQSPGLPRGERVGHTGPADARGLLPAVRTVEAEVGASRRVQRRHRGDWGREQGSGSRAALPAAGTSPAASPAASGRLGPV